MVVHAMCFMKSCILSINFYTHTVLYTRISSNCVGKVLVYQFSSMEGINFHFFLCIWSLKHYIYYGNLVMLKCLTELNTLYHISLINHNVFSKVILRTDNQIYKNISNILGKFSIRFYAQGIIMHAYFMSLPNKIFYNGLNNCIYYFC